MNKRQRSRYLYAVYSVVLALAVLFALFGGSGDWHNAWKSILLNLSTEMLGVTLVFILVNRFFLLDEIGISERMEALISKLEVAEPSAEDFFQKWPDITDPLGKAEKIDICGVGLNSTINKQFGTLRTKLKDGVDVRVLLIDPASLAPKMWAARTGAEFDHDYYTTRVEVTLKSLRILYSSTENSQLLNMQPKKTGILAVRLLSYAPSFGMISLNGGKESARVFVKMYNRPLDGYLSPNFELSPEKDGKWYSYFINQFDQMWADAKPFDVVE